MGRSLLKTNDTTMATISLSEKYRQLIEVLNGLDKDWEVVKAPIKSLVDPSSPKLQSPKLKIYKQLIKKSHVFPPIPVDEKNTVIDGTHRLLAYQSEKFRSVAIIRPISKGTGQVVKDEVYGEGKFVRPANDEIPDCFICQQQLTYFRDNENPGPVAGFPDGLPKPPIYICKNCLIIINRRNFFIWQPLV